MVFWDYILIMTIISLLVRLQVVDTVFVSVYLVLGYGMVVGNRTGFAPTCILFCIWSVELPTFEILLFCFINCACIRILSDRDIELSCLGRANSGRLLMSDSSNDTSRPYSCRERVRSWLKTYGLCV